MIDSQKDAPEHRRAHFMNNLKLAYNLKQKRILICGNRHAETIKKDFDKHVRALYLPEFKTVYFRFYAPNGEYVFIDDNDIAQSFQACESALDAFIEEGIIPRRTKVLFWQTNKKVIQSLVNY